MDISIKAPDAVLIGNDWFGKSVGMQTAVGGIVRHHAQLLLTQIQSHASGRPGPNAPTGDYRRSWTIEFDTGGSASAEVGTNRPQGRRLEYGFVGVDSLGRHYNQPPYPHVAPAVAIVEPMFLTSLAVYVDKL